MADVNPWSPDDPYLYTMKFKLEKGDSETELKCGFRSFEMIDGFFRLNGKQMFLKVLLLQPNYPETMLSPTGAEMVKHEIMTAKTAGFNMIRLHLLPPVPYVLDLADELGILIYEETAIGWIKDGPRIAEHCQREIREMIVRDWNHPAVVIWGLANENIKLAKTLGEEMLKQAAVLDPTRIAIDNSGGTAAIDQFYAWSDQARYFLPGLGIASAIDLHLYLGQVEPVIYNWLLRLGDPGQTQTLEAVNYGRPDDLHELSKSLAAWNGGIFVSEYGYGGLENLSESLATFPKGSISPDYQVLEGYALSLDRIFELPEFKKIFPDVGRFIEATEKIHGQTVFDQTVMMRLNPRISGYGLTSLNDASWEIAAGILDRWRRPKPCFERVKQANNPVQVLLWPGRYCYRQGEEIQLQAWLIAEKKVRGKLSLEWNGAPLSSRKITGQGVIGGEPVIISNVSQGTYLARLIFRTEQNEVRLDERTLWVLPPLKELPVIRLDSKVPGRMGTATPLFCSGKTAGVIDWNKILDLVEQGANLILELNPETAEEINNTNRLPFRITLRAATGNWMPTWHFIPEHPIFDGLPQRCLADAFYASVLPSYSWENPVGEVIAWAVRATIHCGIYTGTTNFEFEKWSDLAVVSWGGGHLIICQFRIDQNNPLAEKFLANLVTFSKEGLKNG